MKCPRCGSSNVSRHFTPLDPEAFSFGTTGTEKRDLADRPLARYAAEIEARHGRVPWLHPVENYGTETPEPEAAIEHPFQRRA